MKAVVHEVIYGIHPVIHVLERDPERFIDVFLFKRAAESRRLKSLAQKLKQAGIIIYITNNRQWLDKKTDGAVHQGVLARVRTRSPYQENDLSMLLIHQTTPFLLILDGITDPHNLGACLRCADAAGVHAVILPRDRAAPLNATAKKVASGAGETVTLIRVKNLSRTLHFLKENNVWVVGTDDKAKHDLYQSKLTGRLALVMGEEGAGMRHLTRKNCNELISIPMAGSVASLNISVAAGICLFEAVRQRR